jgi:hypothetical protein
MQRARCGAGAEAGVQRPSIQMNGAGLTTAPCMHETMQEHSKGAHAQRVCGSDVGQSHEPDSDSGIWGSAVLMMAMGRRKRERGQVMYVPGPFLKLSTQARGSKTTRPR